VKRAAFDAATARIRKFWGLVPVERRGDPSAAARTARLGDFGFRLSSMVKIQGASFPSVIRKVRLIRLVRDEETASSNLASPTRQCRA
jgi:hypothetical protein